jgi:hypothetical protein
MAGHSSRTEDSSAAKVLKLVQSLLRDMHPRDFDIELWDGTRWIGDTKQFHRFTWKINNPDIISDVLRSSNRQIALGGAVIRRDFDILGNLEAAFPLSDYLISKEWSAAEVLRLLAMGVLTERSRTREWEAATAIFVRSLVQLTIILMVRLLPTITRHPRGSVMPRV